MSNKRTDQARAYRFRAEEVRTVAEGTRDQKCREALFRIADGYDRLASGVETTTDVGTAAAETSEYRSA